MARQPVTRGIPVGYQDHGAALSLQGASNSPTLLPGLGACHTEGRLTLYRGQRARLVQDAAGKQFFEIQDPGGNMIEICEE